MQLENELTVPAPVSEVWKTLLDVQRIAPCLPGATVDRVEGDEVAGHVKVKVGPITVSYVGTARFVTKDETEHRFVLQGSGRETRGSGTAAATVEVRMTEQGSSTRVTVSTELDVTGRPAQFGRGVMADVAATLTDQFAACLAEQVRGPAAAGRPTSAAAETAPARDQGEASAGDYAAAEPQAAAQPAQALDFVSTVALPVARRLAPVLAGLVAGLILGSLLGSRRRVVVIIPPANRITGRARATF
jgi:hypothetical protein